MLAFSLGKELVIKTVSESRHKKRCFLKLIFRKLYPLILRAKKWLKLPLKVRRKNISVGEERLNKKQENPLKYFYRGDIMSS